MNVKNIFAVISLIPAGKYIIFKYILCTGAEYSATISVFRHTYISYRALIFMVNIFLSSRNITIVQNEKKSYNNLKRWYISRLLCSI